MSPGRGSLPASLDPYTQVVWDPQGPRRGSRLSTTKLRLIPHRQILANKGQSSLVLSCAPDGSPGRFGQASVLWRAGIGVPCEEANTGPLEQIQEISEIWGEGWHLRDLGKERR